MQGKELTQLSQEQMLARVDQARFPQDLTPQQRTTVAQVAREYGLDPLMKELIVLYGELYVTFPARLRKAQESGDFNGVNTRPGTQEERQARNCGEEDFLFLAQVWRKGSEKPFEGWAKVTRKEIDDAIKNAKANNRKSDALPIVKDPGQHCEKRAICRGLKLAFHLPLPSFEDIGSEDENPPPNFDIESSATELEDEPAPAPPQPEPQPATASTESKPDSSNRRDPDSVKQDELVTTTALLKIANDCWGMQPADVWKELGYQNIRDYESAVLNNLGFFDGQAKLWEAFQQIKVSKI